MEKDEIRNWMLFGGVSLLFTVFVIYLLLGPGLGYAMDAAVERLPLDTEAKIGGKLLETMVTAQVETPAALKPVLAHCAKALPLDGEGRSYKILVMEDAEVNAFALPGGTLVIHRGLLDKLQDESELFGVLGHEAGHVQQRHFLKQVARTAGLGLGLSLLIGHNSGLISVLADGGRELLLKGYGRKEETAADDAGLALLKRLGLDPWGMPRLMQRLQEAEGPGLTLPELLSTHPATPKRRERLEGLLKGVPAKAAKHYLSADEWAALKRKNAPKRAAPGGTRV